MESVPAISLALFYINLFLFKVIYPSIALFQVFRKHLSVSELIDVYNNFYSLIKHSSSEQFDFIFMLIISFSEIFIMF